MKKYSIFQKSVSMLLSLVLVLGMVPVFAAAADGDNIPAAQAEDTRIVDPNTMNEWKNYFGPGKLSTEFAGGVWTDKSVMLNANDFQASISMQDPDNNFLVALSTIAANQKIVGYGSAPVDVMLVLDVSGSMTSSSKASNMIQAANRAIDSLLKENNNNRIGVVLYSGNSKTGASEANTATVILPLNRYTSSNTERVLVGGSWPNYIYETFNKYLTISNNQVSVDTTVKSSNGIPSSNPKTVEGGTYIQNGLYKAWGEFSKVTDVKVPAGQPQAGAQRTPIMVLMSDGRPTTATVDYNNVGKSNTAYGDGDEDNTTWQTVFLTQLTAAWTKGKMTEKYGTAAKFYTLGLGTGTDAYATQVLNPDNSQRTLNTYWNNFQTRNPDDNGKVTVSGSGNNAWKLAKDSNVAGRNYVDLYKLAANTGDLLAAFKTITDSIELDAADYVTLVEAAGEDLSGYVTITDELGAFMEVKDIKGLVLGDALFTGHELAKSLQASSMGTQQDPTAYGDEFIRTVRERLGIDNVTAAQNLVIAAYADGQLAYNQNTGAYSNYIGWYSNDDGDYLGFWDKDTGITATGAPAGATWINKSYGYLGTAGDSDMMHVVVMLSTHIESGMQVMQYKIPASLIPMITYQVELEGSNPEDMKSITCNDASPLRLVYEVGLQEEINAVNMAEKVQEAVDAGHGHAHINADGSYSFYTNLWGDEDGGAIDYNDPLNHNVAKSHFHPAVGNDRYYYTVDTPVYVKNGSNYTMYRGVAAPSGDNYYRAHTYYTAQEGYTTKYIPLSDYALQQAADNGRQSDGWYIPEGAIFQQVDRFRLLKGGDVNSDGKADRNLTGTLEYHDYPVVVDVGDKYDCYAFLGNNGKITIMPAQGIKLTKTVSGVEGEVTDSFTFDITLSQTVEDPIVTDTDGNAITGWSRDGNVITVTLKAGETVCVTGIPTGVTYTVTERKHADFVGSSTNASGTVQAATMSHVDFVNIPRGYGNLIISKDVDHPFVNVPSALTNKEFTINVKLSGEDVANKQFAIADTDPVEYVTTDNNGSFTVTLKDNGSMTVVGLPEGTTFTTTETLDPDDHKGFTMDADRSTLSGTIEKNTTVQTHVINVYAPQAPDTALKIAGNKILTDEAGAFDWEGKSFTVRLEKYDPISGTYTNLGEKQVTQGNLSYLFENEIQFNALGNYFFKVSEVIPTDRLEGMSYDATTGRIEVRVTDDNVDGKMELTVYNYDTGLTIEPVNNVVTFTKDFENVHTTDATYVEFTVNKNLVDTHNTGATEAGYLFELYEVVNGETSTTSTYSMRTVLVDGEGQAVFHIPITKVGERTFILKENTPVDEDKIPGMHYDTTEYTVVVGATSEDGKLVPYMTVTKAGQEVALEDLVFTNEIKLEPLVLKPYVTKTLNGREPLSDSEFTFNIVQTDGSFTTPIANGYSDTTSVGKGDKYFKEITVTQVGTYYFRTTEVIGNTPGMTYDNAIYHVIVDVTADGDKLVKNVTYVKVGQGVPSTQTDFVQFVNTYVNTDTAEVTIAGDKDLTGRDLISGEFSFQLKEGDKVLQTVTNLANGEFAFAPITYTSEDVGVHTYTVVEVNDGKGGVGYDKTSYTVTVKVEDNGKNELIVTTQGADSIKFNNTYTVQSTSVSLSGTKSWYNTDLEQNKEMIGDEFTFELYASNADYSTQGEMVASTTNAADGTFGFTLNYGKAGDYYYLLREQIGDVNGTGYDTGVYHIKIAVYDDMNGKLVGRVAQIYKVGTGDDVIAFGNTYTPVPAQIVIEGTKELTGREHGPVDGEFRFQLKDGDEVLQTVANTGNSFAFEPIEYTKSGTYIYQVVEMVPDLAVNNVYNGVIYDTTVYTVTVTVDDDENGSLNASYTVTEGGTANALTFHNEYTITNPAKFDLDGNKSVYNETLGIKVDMNQYAGKFRFDLYDSNDMCVASANNDATGYFKFTGIPLSTDAKTHSFTLREYVGDLGGITYDAKEYKITVTTTDQGDGSQTAEVTSITLNGMPVTSIEYNNFYKLEPVTTNFRVNKVLENKDLDDGMFLFELVDAQDAVIQTKENLQTGDVVFDDIEYKKPGEYTYTIREVVPTGDKEGITYDTHEVTVTVTVTDNGDGTMSLDMDYTGNQTFTNTYTVTGNPEFSISGNKTLNGRDMTDGEFTFILTDEQGNTTEVKNVGESFSFQNVELPGLGEFTFTITEKDTGKGGVSYDDTEFKVVVAVSDNGVGGMTVSTPVVTRNGVAAELAFVNEYTTEPAEYTITAEKEYNKPLAGGEFSFTLTGEGENQTKTNAADGTVTFDKLTFNAAGTYTYTISEVAGDKDYITYDDTVYTVTIEVVDDNAGKLVVDSVKVNGVANGNITFTNIYTAAPVEHVLVAEKSYTKELTGGEFTFILTGEGENQTKTNAAGGAITFDELTFTEAKTYTYTVTEQAGDKSYITYDDTVYTVSIEVADDEQGKLFVKNVTVSDNKETGNASVKFDNVYVITGEPVFSIDGTKELTGRDIVDGEFTFILTDAAGNVIKTTNVGKTFSFTNVELPGLGEHVFTITEENGGVATITYDATVYTVTVNVVDDNEGGMIVETPVVTVNGEAAQLQFNNVYTEPDPITVELNINKTVTGDMSPKGFKFELVQDGKVVSTAEADAEGKATMGITFTVDALGTHEFVIREANTGIKHVTYDAATYKVQITVTETNDGQLAAAVKLDNADVENVNLQFTNKFDPPSTPETGDTSNPTMLMGTMGISALAIIMLLAVLVLDRKKGKFER